MQTHAPHHREHAVVTEDVAQLLRLKQLASVIGVFREMTVKQVVMKFVEVSIRMDALRANMVKLITSAIEAADVAIQALVIP